MKKNKRFSITLSTELYYELEQTSSIMNLTKSNVVELLCVKHIENLRKEYSKLKLNKA